MAGNSFLMAGGGTGGHVMPLLAVAEQLRRRGHRPYFIGTRAGFEARLVPQRGFPLEFVEVSGFQGAGLGAKAKLAWQMPLAMLRSARSILRHRPRACFSLGGYAAAPPVASATLMGLPLVVMEPNAMPGMVNRIWGKRARKALIAFEEAARYFPPGAVERSGLPVREEFFAIGPRPAGTPFTLLVTGGSQGSQTLNRAVRESWPLFAASGLGLRIVHQCGRREVETLTRDFQSAGVEGSVTAFLEDMPAAVGGADLVLCRAGAGTVNELAAAGRAGIYVPYPFAADDHQTRNAEAMVRAGAGLMATDKELTGRRLFELVASLVADRPRLEAMGEAARRLARPGAAARAADILEEIASENR